MSDTKRKHDDDTEKPPNPELEPLNKAEQDLNDIKERVAQEQAPRNGT